jgi:hypothetical protein
MLAYIGSVIGKEKIRFKFRNTLELIFASVVAQQPLVDQGILIIVASRSHTHHTR